MKNLEAIIEQARPYVGNRKQVSREEFFREIAKERQPNASRILNKWQEPIGYATQHHTQGTIERTIGICTSNGMGESTYWL